MERELYPSIEAMLAPSSLVAVLGRPVTEVHCRPFHATDSKSGSPLLWVEIDGLHGPRYVLKRISARWDWIMRATADHHGRPVVAWQTGLLDRLPRELVHGVIACARDGEGWALLLEDVSNHLIPAGDQRIGEGENARIVDAMAALHSTFWAKPEAVDPDLGFCQLDAYYRLLSPATARREANSPDAIPPLVEGWRLLETAIDPALARQLIELAEDSRPLCDALAQFPQTVTHRDWKLGNLGLQPGPHAPVVLLDWAMVGPAPPAVDLAWYVAINSARLPVPQEATIDRHRRALARRIGSQFNESWWQPQLELCLLGAFVQFGWEKALGAMHSDSAEVRTRERAELTWWSARASSALRLL
jgi:Phosphotransferase enzyme family